MWKVLLRSLVLASLFAHPVLHSSIQQATFTPSLRVLQFLLFHVPIVNSCASQELTGLMHVEGWELRNHAIHFLIGCLRHLRCMKFASWEHQAESAPNGTRSGAV
jgi:hypothetical protein